MNLSNNIIKFYDTIDTLKVSGDSIKVQREKISNVIANFNKKIESVAIDERLKKENLDLYSLFETSINETKNKITFWTKSIEEQNNKEKFRDELKDKFIVIIFGKVKAGKSTLGNFIASQSILKEKAKFFMYDEAGREKKVEKLEEIDEDGFKTDNLECTSSIQGFNLGGLSWIDTPGLGSMTKENGELAKSYIELADYIIFPTSSANVLLNEEIIQIKELLEQNKSLTVCITRSDIKETRKDNNGKLIKNEEGSIKRFNVNKNIETRELQENDANKRLKEELGDKANLIEDIFSLSVYCAKDGLETNNNELFDNSNIDKFYEKMLDIVEKKANYLKTNAPKQNLIAYIDNSIIGNTNSIYSLNSIKNDFKTVLKELELLNENLNLKIKNIGYDISSNISTVLSSYAMDITPSNSKDLLKKVDIEISKNIESLVSETINELFKSFETSLYNFQKIAVDESEYLVEDKYEKLTVRYESSGFFRKLANKVTFGLVEKTYSSVSEQVYVGNNKEEILSNFKSKRVAEYSKEIELVLSNLQNNFFKKFHLEIEKISQYVNEVEQELEDIKNSLK